MKSFKVVRKNIGTLPGQMRGWLSLQGNRDLCADMAELFRRSASTGCTYHELGTLYRHIIRHRPRHVLELGSGMSTLVLAHAARLVRDQGGECQVISMEEDSFYFDNLMSLLPAWVSDYATVVHSPLRDEEVGGAISRSYRDTPQLPYDLVFVDGPQVPREATHFDGDLLKVMDWNPNRFEAYIDGRRGTRENFARLMPWLEMSYDPIHHFTHIRVPERANRAVRNMAA